MAVCDSASSTTSSGLLEQQRSPHGLIFDILVAGPKALLSASPQTTSCDDGGIRRASNHMLASSTQQQLGQQRNRKIDTVLSVGCWCFGLLALYTATATISSWKEGSEERSRDGAPGGKQTTSTWRTHFHGFLKHLFITIQLQRQHKQLPPTPHTSNTSKYITHTGSCQCGDIQFKLRGPKKLDVIEPSRLELDQPMIQYPRICVQVKDFVLQSGYDEIQSFHHRYRGGKRAGSKVSKCQTASAAYTFCSTCGVHVFSALQQNKNELFINLRCLKVGTFVSRDLNSPPSKALRVLRSFASLTTATTASTATVFSDEDIDEHDVDDDSGRSECIVSKDDVSGITEHVNVAVAVSPNYSAGYVSPKRLMHDGISIVSGDVCNDDMSTSIATTATNLEETTYRLRKALSGDGSSSISSSRKKNRNTLNDDVVMSSSDWNKMSSQTVPSPIAIRTDNNNSVNYIGTNSTADGIHTVPEDDVMASSFMDMSSYHNEQVDVLSLSQDVESQDQLRKFMSRHMAKDLN